MRLAVLADAGSWYLRDLVRAAGTGHQILPLPFPRIRSSIAIGSEPPVAAERVALRDCDAVLVRTMPPGSLEQVVFRMDALGQCEAEGTPVINPPKALEAAVDKYLATARMQAAGLPVPPTVVCQHVEDAMEAFLQFGSDVVVKPLFGSEGRGICRVTDEAVALRTFKTLASLGAVIYVQQFIEHEGADLRLLVLGKQIFAMRRRNPDDWRTNVGRGALTEPFQPADLHLELARQAAEVIGAPLAGVDLLPAKDGRLLVLEVNAVPGWKALAQTLDVDIAAQVLRFLEQRTEASR